MKNNKTNTVLRRINGILLESDKVKLSSKSKDILNDILNAMKIIRQGASEYSDAFERLHEENQNGKISDDEHSAIIDAIVGSGRFDDNVFGENPDGESIYKWIDNAKSNAQKLK